ncbi:alpha/beta fold hydrolase [Pusillimonas noertemannii]|uniref:Pimeloyl-ACP methyl ester carboxylesterase n=1 Tax=Pusillimonas noertemannii TaxID=305977 RepID=A0A2U1CN88_9BURK|nr:alpha/beta hydrolase [Pusillimonas noertemannii]NYT68500.1 alpha/beta hydrolase [Pusillimonas noertemannii]PVY62483.1 pimeloyl-ACP methyl ester carboxylesterase [Pusillimonas noertemannii]TFL10562.1 alpha/beta hydrolase [Pusillimonas noertemannii]
MPHSSQSEYSQGRTSNGLAYERRGKGLPLVLLHGWCLNAKMWAYAQEDLGADHEIITFDLAGFGRSSHLAGPYGFERHARDLAAAFNELELQRPVVAGFAFGAAIAVALGKSNPTQITAVIAVGLPSAQASPYAKMPRAMRRDWPGFARKSAEALFYNTQSEATLGWIERMFGDASLCVAVETVRLLEHYEPAEAVKGLELPTLLIHGDQDQVAPVATGQACAQAIPGSKLAVVENCGHLIVIDNKNAFHDVVRSFLSTL